MLVPWFALNLKNRSQCISKRKGSVCLKECRDLPGWMPVTWESLIPHSPSFLEQSLSVSLCLNAQSC